MNLLRNPRAVARSVPESKMKWLGTARGREYGVYRDQEYAVDLRGADPDSYTPDENEIIVVRRKVELLDDGARWETDTTCRAFPVPSGTYGGLAKRGKAAAEKPLRAWDRLADLAILRRREPMRMVTGPASSAYDRLPTIPAGSTEQQEAIAGAVDLANRNPSRQLIEIGGNEPPERSVAGLLAFIEARGVELSLHRGRLLARSRDPIRQDVRDLIEQAHELIVGHLKGQPVICSTCASPAVTIAAIDAPMCAEHAE